VRRRGAGIADVRGRLGRELRPTRRPGHAAALHPQVRRQRDVAQWSMGRSTSRRCLHVQIPRRMVELCGAIDACLVRGRFRRQQRPVRVSVGPRDQCHRIAADLELIGRGLPGCQRLRGTHIWNKAIAVCMTRTHCGSHVECSSCSTWPLPRCTTFGSRTVTAPTMSVSSSLRLFNTSKPAQA